jgi:flavin-dependent dehydrogenase
MINTQVCIVGAGPAGTTASLFLSKYGIDHVMVEMRSLPYDKVCGEVFAGRVIHVLNEIDSEWTKELFRRNIIVQSKVIRYFWDSLKKGFHVKFPTSSSPFIKSRRKDFDYELLLKAKDYTHLTYIDKCNITSYIKTENGIILSDDKKKVTITAKMVLICNGSNTNSLKRIFPDYSMKGEQYLVMRQYFTNVNYEDEKDYASEVYFYTKPFTHFLYTTRLPNNRAMIEICVSKQYAKKHDFDLENNIFNSIEKTQKLNQRFSKALVSGKAQGTSLLMGSIPRKLSEERFLVAGSAIGQVHVLTGVGVGHAMRSGQLAAFFAAKSLKENNFSASFLKQYDKEILKRFKSDFNVSKFVCSFNAHSKFAYYASMLGGAVRWLQIKILCTFESITFKLK